MEETQADNIDQEQQQPGTGRLSANWRACLLLVVMLLGLLATPMAVLYRWASERSDDQSAALLARQGGINRIAFIQPDGQLATISPDGSDLRRLTEKEEGLEFPAWSPDGRQLAVIGPGKVLLVAADANQETFSAPIKLYEDRGEAPFYLYWSPDSQQITFLANHPEGIALHLAQGRESGAASRLLMTGQPFYWDWAPTSEELFIHSGGSGARARLEMIDLYGSTTADGYGPAGVFQSPGISHDGRFRAYAVLDDDGSSRLIVQDETGEPRRFEAHVGQLALTWSPATNVLAYRSPRPDGRFNGGPLHLHDPRTGDDAVLSGQDVLAFFWSPDGRTIAYFSWPREFGDVRVASADKSTYRARPLRQHDGLRLELWAVDVASGQQSRLLQFRPTARFLRQFLPYFDQYALSHRIWSPSSDALVVPVFEEGRSQIAVVTLNHEEVTLIADGETAFWSYQ